MLLYDVKQVGHFSAPETVAGASGKKPSSEKRSRMIWDEVGDKGEEMVIFQVVDMLPDI